MQISKINFAVTNARKKHTKNQQFGMCKPVLPQIITQKSNDILDISKEADTMLHKLFPFTDKETGEKSIVSALFDRIGAYREKVKITLNNKFVGDAIILTNLLKSNSGPRDVGIVKDIAEVGNCIYTDLMHSYKPGIGTIIHKAVAKRSQDLGYKGRIMLMSAWAAAPFHYSCGFRIFLPQNADSFDKELAEINEKAFETMIEKAKTTGERIKRDLGSHKMYLSEENAAKLLNDEL